MTSMGPSIVTLYLSFFLMSLASMGTIHVTWTHLDNLWFEQNRGLALAMALSGTGLAAMLIPSAVSSVVTQWGWQAAFWLLAALPVALVLPLVLVWMKEPALATARVGDKLAPVKGVAVGMTLREGLRNPRFWMLNIALSLIVACVVTLVTNGVPLLRDKGLDAVDAARIFGSPWPSWRRGT